MQNPIFGLTKKKKNPSPHKVEMEESNLVKFINEEPEILLTITVMVVKRLLTKLRHLRMER